MGRPQFYSFCAIIFFSSFSIFFLNIFFVACMHCTFRLLPTLVVVSLYPSDTFIKTGWVHQSWSKAQQGPLKIKRWKAQHFNNKPLPPIHQACWYGWRAASCGWLSLIPQGPSSPLHMSLGMSPTLQQMVRKERRSVSAGLSLCPLPRPRTSMRVSMPWCVQRNRPKSSPSPPRPASINTASQRPPSSYGQMWCRWAKACAWLVSVPTAISWPSGEKHVSLHQRSVRNGGL